MPRMCSVCGKTYSRTIKRSHSMRSSIRRLLPNLQWARDDKGQRIKICTRCLKTRSKVTTPRAVKVPRTAKVAAT